MGRGLQVAVIAACLWAGVCRADVIFSSYPKQLGGGYGFCGPQNFLNFHDYDEAQRFVVPADGNYTLDHVRLALDHVVGNNHGATVCLMSEAAGDTMPGDVLDCAPSFIVPGTDPVDLDVYFPGAPVLQANTPYWIACSTTGDAYIGWTISAAAPGNRASRRDGGGWLPMRADKISAWQVYAVQFVTGVEPASGTAALKLRASPNPFHPGTTIWFDIPAGGDVKLAVYDAAGRLIRSLKEADLPAGSHEEAWDGRDQAGQAVASGCYFARLSVGGKVKTVRMGLVR